MSTLMGNSSRNFLGNLQSECLSVADFEKECFPRTETPMHLEDKVQQTALPRNFVLSPKMPSHVTELTSEELSMVEEPKVAAAALEPVIVEDVKQVSYAELSSATVDAPASWSDHRLSDRARLIATWDEIGVFPAAGERFGDHGERRFLRCGPNEQLCLSCFDVPCACRRVVHVETVPPSMSSTLSWDPGVWPRL